MDLDKLIAIGKELGIDVELNSDEPGMFVRDGEGGLRKVSMEEVMF